LFKLKSFIHLKLFFYVVFHILLAFRKAIFAEAFKKGSVLLFCCFAGFF